MLLRLSEENVTSNSLKFLLDENIRVEIKKFLESEGFSAEYASKGTGNSKLASLAKDKRFVLLTRDVDFTNVALYPPKEFGGIVVFRIHPPKAEKLVKALYSLLKEVKEFAGKLFVVEDEGFEVIEG